MGCLTVLHCRETSNSDEEIVLWFEIDLDEWPASGAPFIAQWGKIDKSGQGWECYDPSIAVSESQHVAVTWTQSGPETGQFMAMWRGVRCPADGAGTLTDTQQLVASLGIISGPLAADYSGTSTDPSDDTVFWGHSMILEQQNTPDEWESWLATYTVQCTTLRGECYADCDSSTGVGVLDVFDFLCFQNLFDAGSPAACECDVSTGRYVCDVFDFLCFQDAYFAGCP